MGAINAAYLAAAADRGDLGIGGLVDLWTSLRLDVHLRLRAPALTSMPFLRSWRRKLAATSGWSLLDVGSLEQLVGDGIAWSGLHANIRRGIVRALIVAALDVSTGRTTMFAELADGVTFNPSRDPKRAAYRGEIGRDHVLASSALPLLFPARRIADAYFCDGGLRFNTPLAPAIRVGADRLVVISVLRTERPSAGHAYHPDLAFLVGKLFNALIADLVVYDLQVLERFNRLMSVLETSLDHAELERVQQVMIEARGARYQRLETLVFQPSRDIGVMAGDHVRRAGGIGHGVQGSSGSSCAARRTRRPTGHRTSCSTETSPPS